MNNVFCTLLIITVLSSCSNSQSIFSGGAGSQNAESSKLGAVLWQQTSAEYKALCHQAFNIARAQLESGQVMRNSSGNSDRKPAIVLDLDETVLNNSPYNGWLITNNKSYSEETWREWVLKAKATFIPGAQQFIDFAQSNGYEVFYISNRSVELLEPTLSNLEKSGIDINKNHVFLKTNTSSKNERRKKVRDNYDIVMLIGDNLADFNNEFDEELDIEARKNLIEKFSSAFGNKFIVLPNAMYGDWEKAMKLLNSGSIQNQSNGPIKFLKGF